MLNIPTYRNLALGVYVFLPAVVRKETGHNNKIRHKKSVYRSLDLGDLTDNRKFWETVKPAFSNEIQTTSSVTLMEDGKMITEDTKIAEIFNHYFANTTESL